MHGFRIGLAFGFGFFGALLIWISVVGWVAWLLLVVMEALFLGFFGAAWAHVSRLQRATWIVTAPALWVMSETLRSSVPVVGFPWGELAQSQGPFPWLLQISQIGGGKTVSFVLVVVNVLVVWAWRDRGAARLGDIALASGLLAVMPLVSYVVPRMDGDPKGTDHVVRVAIIQGNASPGVRVENERARVARHVELTRSIAGRRPDLVIWPESSVGIDPFADAEVATLVSEAARAVDAPMIVGANLDAPRDRYLVMALLVSPSGDFIDSYQKRHLVPFGEYIPWRAGLEWIPMLDQVPRDAVAGDVAENFSVPAPSIDDAPSVETYEVGAVVSFEGDFSNLVREHVAAGAQLLVVATNTSTWERTWASAQHVAMSQVRAAESRVPVAHAALSGISAAIGPGGAIHATTPLYEEATLVYDVATSSDVSIYARTGEWLPITCTIISLAAFAIAYRRRGSLPR